MIIRFDLGDWSLDGHGRGRPVFLDSSHTSDEIAAAYAGACQELGFVLHERVCAQYQDRMISPEDLDFLKARIGYVPDADGFDPAWQSLTAEDVFGMFLCLVRFGDPGITVTPWGPDETFFRAGVPGRMFSLGYGTFEEECR